MTDSPAERRRSPAQSVARGFGQLLWCLIPILSLGMLTWVPAVQAWWKVRTAGWALTTVLLIAGSVGVVTGLVTDVDNSALLGMLLIGGAIGGTAAAAAGRRIVFADDESPRGLDPSVAQVLDRRERRSEARGIAATDPAMALELGIGRPDLTRSYDDGGMIDLNNADADAIAGALGWSRSRAREFVAERDRREGFESLTELAAMSTIPTRILDRASDRVLLLPYVRTPD